MAQKLFFAANDGTTGNEPRIIDIADGTITVLGDFVPGPGSGIRGSGSAIALGNELLFAVATDTDGLELFITDGTAAGTRKVIDLNIGDSGSSPKQFVRVGDQVFFTAFTPGVGRELFRTDGTEAGTRIVVDLNEGPNSALNNELQDATAFGDRLLFSAFTPDSGLQPYITDGSPGGTRLLFERTPGAVQAVPNFFPDTVLDGFAYFTMKDETYGRELWRTDGTTEGTTMVRDINPGSAGSQIFSMSVLNGVLIFGANGPSTRDEDGDGEPDPSGYELWRSDGTEAGTYLLKDIEPSFAEGSGPGAFAVLGDRAVFAASTLANGYSLWVTDGTETGTMMIADLLPESAGWFEDITPFGDGTRAVMSAASDVGIELWVTDGTAGGTRLIKDIDLTTTDWRRSLPPTAFTPVGDLVYFVADDGIHGRELWVTDGTTAGTRMVEDTNPGPAEGFPEYLTAFETRENTPPFFVGIEGGTIREDAAIGQIVGRFVVTDEDGDTVMLTLTDDAGGLFELRGDRLYLSGPLDFETAASHEIRVDAFDGANNTRAGFTIDVRDVAEIAGTSGDDTLVGTDDADNLDGKQGDDLLRGGGGPDAATGGEGADRILGEDGDDTLDGGPGPDTLNGGAGNDSLIGGPADGDLRDIIYAGEGHDSVDAGAGNDLVFGQGGNDTIAGGFGVDEIQGQDGDDVITGSAFSDLVFGGAGDDFVNGGFGHDRINGGSGADKFFHTGAEGHGSDWVQDYNAAEGDVLLFGNTAAARGDFQVNFAHTANTAGERAGDDAVQEAFVIYRPTGQIMWALVDGEGQDSIHLQIGSEVFDLLR